MSAGPRWAAEEEWLLEDLVGTDVFAVVYQRYRAIAKQNGWPERSKAALYYRSRLLGLRAVATDDNLNRYEVARQLGIQPHRVRTWVDRYPCLKSRKVGRCYRLSLADLRNFALKRPYLFWGVDEIGLANLIGETYAPHVLRKNHRKDTRRAVICVETGAVYPSLHQAARAFMRSDYERSRKGRSHVLAANIRSAALNPSLTAYGCHWRFVEELRASA
ncbi:hypothetical protein [Synechococcus elongatus]|uniref:Uncharacterized protein n=2 Tax=Synechococcus elongatus TaxID=32046 RepID=Q31QB9_SYNE7|nr:hypothetical protein [Synechococcus elongatus]ABB56750.1 conserved hypothetical protein [Synechococcus elongatus PCC 7942 = FACHB-805]AJD58709.1 hypothetical protein M744_13175 [Synechococcus elongatus UTEX 2973]MBD2588611.1 hypothetical protein [Synechococcus elongatus FACHB-242]MBD2689800.1 hypothetical protein [Synechococcus elongatus FACHB-1061]MBD2708407.1 hypothetical protein [Synechococcus elongatus PCC 7942 = FACHB-805]